MRALSNAFKDAVHWLAEKPADPKDFCNPLNLLPSLTGKFNRGGALVERVTMLPAMFASATAAMASTVLGHPVGVGAATAAAKVGSAAAGALTHMAVKALDKALNPQQKTTALPQAGQALPVLILAVPVPARVPHRVYAYA